MPPEKCRAVCELAHTNGSAFFGDRAKPATEMRWRIDGRAGLFCWSDTQARDCDALAHRWARRAQLYINLLNSSAGIGP